MSIISGYLCLICFCILLVKVITRKMQLKKTDIFFMKMHKYVSAVLLVICVLHIVLVFPVLKTHTAGVWIAGGVTAVTMLLLIVLCHTITQDKKLNLRVHRILSAVMALGIVAHVLTYFNIL